MWLVIMSPTAVLMDWVLHARCCTDQAEVWVGAGCECAVL